MHGDRKGQRRGLRVELVPGEAPRLVLEPWETVLPVTAGIYRGRAARVVRLWGRRRLLLLRRLLPYVEQVEVHLLGSGLPSFWVLRAGPVTLTLGLTGFTAANWSQAVSFDLLLPRKTQGGAPLEAVLNHLATVWVADSCHLPQATGLTGEALAEALQAGCQQGKLMYDLAADIYRLRALTEAPLDLARLEYRNQRERSAHDLLARRGAVQIVSENRIGGTGLELTGKVAVSEDRREYRPQLLLNDKGMVGRAECTCTFFRKQGLKAGPCAHLVALRLAYAAQEARRARGIDPRQAITVETRSFSRRDAGGEDVVQVTLDRTRLKVRWGRAGRPTRLQVLRFNSADEARAAYFARVAALEARGYLDALAGG
jgi:predicted DNA-binding WGR domain protein